MPPEKGARVAVVTGGCLVAARERKVPDAGAVALRVSELYVERGGATIVHGISLRLRSGKLHAVIGPNGSGKSTLAQALMGCSGYRIAAGRVWLGSEDITDLDLYERAKRGLTLAWQEPARIEGLTVGRYVGLGCDRPSEADVCRALDAVDLEPKLYRGRCVDESLSGGERRRIELAAVYAMHPKVAVLDEVDSGIDGPSISAIARLIRQLAKEGTAVLLMSHQEEVIKAADEAFLLSDGRILVEGRPRRLVRRYGDYYRATPQGQS
jgi:Fe-S cluster assembly ATP-binding protein